MTDSSKGVPVVGDAISSKTHVEKACHSCLASNNMNLLQESTTNQSAKFNTNYS